MDVYIVYIYIYIYIYIHIYGHLFFNCMNFLIEKLKKISMISCFIAIVPLNT